MTDTVLVTGATGFIAQHCIIQLLDAGYAVRGTARSADRTAEVAQIISPHLSEAARARLDDDFEIIAADLTAGAGRHGLSFRPPRREPDSSDATEAR
jgi:dihydroflavonol-4-reductase